MTRITRRKFLGTLGALSLPLILPGRLRGALAPSKQITLGFIGTGQHGIGVNLKCFLPLADARVLVVCDVKTPHATEAKALVDAAYGNSDCKVEQDFRAVLARKDLDAVVISTPDHWHVPISLMALEAGLHTFSEKPTLTISEGRRLVEAVAKSGKAFQWGIEDRSLGRYHKLVEWTKNGAIGNLERVIVTLPQLGPPTPFPLENPSPIPPDLDWNLWLGPAPFHPYTAGRTAPDRWRRIFDYSGGRLTDWGAHLVDTAQVAAGVDATGPVEIEGTGTIPTGTESNTPMAFDIRYTYANGVTIEVHEGDGTIRMIGSKGWVECKGWDGELVASNPEILHTRYEIGQQGFLPLPPREQRNFLDSIASGRPATYFPEAGHRLFTTLHLGHLAIRTGKKLTWDPAAEKLLTDVDDPGILSRPSRDWTKDA